MNTNRTLRNAGRPALSPLETVKGAVSADQEWRCRLAEAAPGIGQKRSLHLAVFVGPFLDCVLDGRKTVESRFGSVRCPPYGRVQQGDLVLLKRSGGPVCGVIEVGAVWSYRLDRDSWGLIRRQFTESLCAQDPQFWKAREHATYATLMQIQHVRRLPEITWPKRDRRGWVVVHSAHSDKLLFGADMRKTVLGFSGGIATGKSSLSEAVARALGCPRVSFGEHVRSRARAQGLDQRREILQALGEQLIRQDIRGFCRAVLADADWKPGNSLIIDGVRHAAVISVLKEFVAPSELRLVHIEADEKSRLARLTARGESDSGLANLERHSTESDVRTVLPGIADLVVDGSRPLQIVANEVTTWASTLP
jgi:dephospho-CoA kinase